MAFNEVKHKWDGKRAQEALIFYLKIRDGDTVKSEYLGNGEVAYAVAALEAEERQRRASEWKKEQILRKKDVQSENLLQDVEYRLKTVIKAHLMNLGFNQSSSREWRLSRDARRSDNCSS